MKVNLSTFLSEIPFDAEMVDICREASIFTVLDLTLAMKDHRLPSELDLQQRIDLIKVFWKWVIGLPLEMKGEKAS